MNIQSPSFPVGKPLAFGKVYKKRSGYTPQQLQGLAADNKVKVGDIWVRSTMEEGKPVFVAAAGDDADFARGIEQDKDIDNSYIFKNSSFAKHATWLSQ